MECQDCGQQLPAQSRFCNRCGRALGEAVCTACGQTLPPGSLFCNACGRRVAEPDRPARDPVPAGYTPRHLADRILTTRAALEGERKQVTVLFADVKGSMEIAEGVDPEDLHRIMDRFFAILADGIHRFEGTVNQYTGDGIMALFGAPLAHEDHAHRACWAALAIREDMKRYSDELRVERGLSFSLRLGLNSGEVVVGRIGDDLRMDYTAQGFTVGLAARMEQLAEPGAVLLTENTARLVSGYFALRDLGASRVKGVRESLHVFELEGAGSARTRLDVSRARGLSRFVGRSREVGVLRGALDRAVSGGGRVVGVVGDAGVGKSRVCLEFAEDCRSRGIAVFSAHCRAHARAVPFLPMLELLRSVLGVSEAESPHETRRNVAGELLLLDDAFRELLPFVFELLAVPDPERPAPPLDAEVRRQRLVAFVRQLVRARAAREPEVLLVDDLQWIDPASESLLAEVVEAVRDSRTLLLVNFRPGYRVPWMERSYYQQLPVPELDGQSCQDLMGDLLGGDSSLAGLPAFVLERTHGNPFYMEEVVRSLAEAGALTGPRGGYRLARPVAELAIPDSVQSIVSARLDRLPEREKRVLEAAAVVGRDFSVSLLEKLAGLPADSLARALARLVEADFLLEESIYPDARYAFRHPLTQDVAYRAQLHARRARLHAEVARALAELHAGREGLLAGILAHHWEAAGCKLEAARSHKLAAEVAGAADRNEALRHWRRVRALAKACPGGEPRALELAACERVLSFAQRTGLSREEADAVYEEGRAIAEAAGDVRSLTLLEHAVTRQKTEDVRAWLAQAERVAELATRSGEEKLRLYMQVDVVNASMHLGRLAPALALVEESLARYDAEPALASDSLGARGRDWHRWFRSILLMHLGRLDDAERALRELVRVARERAAPEMLRDSLSVLTELAVFSGDSERALALALEAREVADKLATPFQLAWAEHMLGLARSARGEFGPAREALERSLELTRASQTTPYTEAFVLTHLAEATLGAGAREEGERLARSAVDLARTEGGRLRECGAALALSRALLAHGTARLAESEEALESAAALASDMRAESRLPSIHAQRARLAAAKGEPQSAARHLEDALRVALRIGARGHAASLRGELADGGSP